MTYIDPSEAIIAKMIAFDKECIYTHLVSPPPIICRVPVEVEHEWVADEQSPTRWQQFRRWIHEVVA